MPAESQRVSMPAGDSQRIRIGVVDKDGAPVPLAGALAVRWWLARTYSSTEAGILIKKSLADQTLSVSGADIVINILPGDTDGLASNSYYHEAEIIFGDGTVKTVMRGTFTITSTIIRPAP